MKARTMVYLEEDQLQALREDARRRKISLAELFRRLADDYLTDRRSPSKASPEKYLKIVGLGSSGKRDISRRHDDYLAQALDREHRR